MPSPDAASGRGCPWCGVATRTTHRPWCPCSAASRRVIRHAYSISEERGAAVASAIRREAGQRANEEHAEAMEDARSY